MVHRQALAESMSTPAARPCPASHWPPASGGSLQGPAPMEDCTPRHREGQSAEPSLNLKSMQGQHEQHGPPSCAHPPCRFDAAPLGCTRATVVAADEHVVSMTFDDTAGHHTHAGFGNQLDAHTAERKQRFPVSSSRWIGCCVQIKQTTRTVRQD